MCMFSYVFFLCFCLMLVIHSVLLLFVVLRVICWFFFLHLLALMYREVNKHACMCVCVCFQELDFAFEDHLEGSSRLYLRGMKLIRTFQLYTSAACVCLCFTFVYINIQILDLTTCSLCPLFLLLFLLFSLRFKHIKIRLR